MALNTSMIAQDLSTLTPMLLISASPAVLEMFTLSQVDNVYFITAVGGLPDWMLPKKVPQVWGGDLFMPATVSS